MSTIDNFALKTSGKSVFFSKQWSFQSANSPVYRQFNW